MRTIERLEAGGVDGRSHEMRVARLQLRELVARMTNADCRELVRGAKGDKAAARQLERNLKTMRNEFRASLKNPRCW